jgi:hypothetical protein
MLASLQRVSSQRDLNLIVKNQKADTSCFVKRLILFFLFIIDWYFPFDLNDWRSAHDTIDNTTIGARFQHVPEAFQKDTETHLLAKIRHFGSFSRRFDRRFLILPYYLCRQYRQDPVVPYFLRTAGAFILVSLLYYVQVCYNHHG